MTGVVRTWGEVGCGETVELGVDEAGVGSGVVTAFTVVEEAGLCVTVCSMCTRQ